MNRAASEKCGVQYAFCGRRSGDDAKLKLMIYFTDWNHRKCGFNKEIFLFFI